MTTRTPLAAKSRESEASFQAAVIALARTCGWRVWHTPDSRRTESGEPDLRLLRAPRLIYAELKKATGRVSPEQRAVLAELAQVPGIEVYLWRPSDWERITAVLLGGGVGGVGGVGSGDEGRK